MTKTAPTYPVVGVGVLVWRDGEVLLIRRGKPPREGQWSLPGGRQELGETVREAAVREVREEAGIEIELGNLVDVVDAIGRGPNGDVTHHYTLLDFDADWTAGEVRAGSDAADAMWIDLAGALERVTWQETKRIIELSVARRAAAKHRS